MEDILEGKTLVALGDSLIYGSLLGNEATWVNKLAKKHRMTVYNHGKNGNPVAEQSIEPNIVPMCRRYAEMEDGADYVVVLAAQTTSVFRSRSAKTMTRCPPPLRAR